MATDVVNSLPKQELILKHTYFNIVALEEALESPLECKENKPIHFEGNQA